MWETKNKPLEMIQAFSLMEAALHKLLLVCAFCYLALIQSTPRHGQLDLNEAKASLTDHLDRRVQLREGSMTSCPSVCLNSWEIYPLN